MLQGDSSMQQLAKLNILGGNELFLMCSLSLSFFWISSSHCGSKFTLGGWEGSGLTGDQFTQHTTPTSVWESFKRFLNRKFLRKFKWKETEGRKKKGKLESFPVIVRSLFLVWREGLEVRVVGNVRWEGWKGEMATVIGWDSQRKIGEAWGSLWG